MPKKTQFTLVVALVTLALTSIPALAGSPSTATPPPAAAPAFQLPPFEVGIGFGELATDRAGNLQEANVRFEANVSASFRWFPTEHFALGLGVTRDTVKISEWLVAHRFVLPRPLTAYQYTAADLSVFYYPLRTAKGDLYAGLDMTTYFAPSNTTSGTKVGYGFSLGGDYVLGKGFAVGAYLRYRHVEDFLVPVANVVEPGIRVTYRF